MEISFSGLNPEIQRFLSLAREALARDPGLPSLYLGKFEPGDDFTGWLALQRHYFTAMTASRIKVRMLKLKLRGAQAALKEFQRETEENDFLAALCAAQIERLP